MELNKIIRLGVKVMEYRLGQISTSSAYSEISRVVFDQHSQLWSMWSMLNQVTKVLDRT